MYLLTYTLRRGVAFGPPAAPLTFSISGVFASRSAFKVTGAVGSNFPLLTFQKVVPVPVYCVNEMQTNF